MEEVGSNLNPLALAFLVIMSLLLLGANRQTAVGTLLVGAAIIPLGQQLVVFGLHFHFLRLLLLVGLCRVLVQQETTGIRWNRLDKLFLAWALVGLFCGILKGPKAETFGVTYNALGAYFLIRCLMREPEEVVTHLRILAVLVLVIGALMYVELITRKNPFFIFGGVPEVLQERGDRVRCQGPFRIPILAGTFAATLFPLMVGLWFQDSRRKLVALLGMAGCVAVTVLSNSSGPLLSFVAALAGLALWRMRDRMRLFRRGAVAVIIVLAFVMKAPVWFLIARVSDLIGGGGWHRSFVIDVAVKHFSEWWLIGTSRTADWAEGYQVLLVDPNNMDITNHFVVQAVGGGIWMLGLFLATLVFCFKTVGRGVRAEFDLPLSRKMMWTIGAALAAHCTAFISIAYFDQIAVFWFWLLAVIGSLASRAESTQMEMAYSTDPSDRALDNHSTAEVSVSSFGFQAMNNERPTMNFFNR